MPIWLMCLAQLSKIKSGSILLRYGHLLKELNNTYHYNTKKSDVHKCQELYGNLETISSKTCLLYCILKEYIRVVVLQY